MTVKLEIFLTRRLYSNKDCSLLSTTESVEQINCIAFLKSVVVLTR